MRDIRDWENDDVVCQNANVEQFLLENHDGKYAISDRNSIREA